MGVGPPVGIDPHARRPSQLRLIDSRRSVAKSAVRLCDVDRWLLLVDSRRPDCQRVSVQMRDAHRLLLPIDSRCPDGQRLPIRVRRRLAAASGRLAASPDGRWVVGPDVRRSPTAAAGRLAACRWSRGVSPGMWRQPTIVATTTTAAVGVWVSGGVRARTPTTRARTPPHPLGARGHRSPQQCRATPTIPTQGMDRPAAGHPAVER